MDIGDAVDIYTTDSEVKRGIVADVRTHGLTVEDEDAVLWFYPWSSIQCMHLISDTNELSQSIMEAADAHR